MRAWDFESGQAFWSKQPAVFSFSTDPLNKRDFMNVSTSEHTWQQFCEPGEGGVGNGIINPNTISKKHHPNQLTGKTFEFRKTIHVVVQHSCSAEQYVFLLIMGAHDRL